MTIMRCSVLTWDTLYQLAIISTDDIIEVTAMVGKETEELAEFLEDRYPGITQTFVQKYLDATLDALPKDVLPSKDEVEKFIKSLDEKADADEIRARAVAHFENKVNRNSPQWAIRAMIAMIEFSLGNIIEASREAGFAENEVADSNFREALYGKDREKAKQALLVVERKKADILAAIIRERRLAA